MQSNQLLAVFGGSKYVVLQSLLLVFMSAANEWNLFFNCLGNILIVSCICRDIFFVDLSSFLFFGCTADIFLLLCCRELCLLQVLDQLIVTPCHLNPIILEAF